MSIETGKTEVAAFMKRCYDRALTTATGGNISMRFGAVMLITPSGKDKASLTADDIAEVRISDGKNLTPDKKLSSESDMHRRIYISRPDVGAVVHSHPTFSCLFAASEESINTALVAENWFLLDKVKKVSYALMGSEALAKSVAAAAETHDALLLENHGALAVGRTLLSAFDRLESLEQAAKLTYLSHTVRCRSLTGEERAEIALMR